MGDASADGDGGELGGALPSGRPARRRDAAVRAARAASSSTGLGRCLWTDNVCSHAIACSATVAEDVSSRPAAWRAFRRDHGCARGRAGGLPVRKFGRAFGTAWSKVRITEPIVRPGWSGEDVRCFNSGYCMTTDRAPRPGACETPRSAWPGGAGCRGRVGASRGRSEPAPVDRGALPAVAVGQGHLEVATCASIPEPKSRMRWWTVSASRSRRARTVPGRESGSGKSVTSLAIIGCSAAPRVSGTSAFAMPPAGCAVPRAQRARCGLSGRPRVDDFQEPMTSLNRSTRRRADLRGPVIHRKMKRQSGTGRDPHARSASAFPRRSGGPRLSHELSAASASAS
jgi:hypothetical protein